MQHEKTTYFSFCTAENGNKENCDVMLPNSIRCKKKVSKFVTYNPPKSAAITARNFCEAHFQIEFAKALRDGAVIVNKNEEAELEKLKQK